MTEQVVIAPAQQCTVVIEQAPPTSVEVGAINASAVTVQDGGGGQVDINLEAVPSAGQQSLEVVDTSTTVTLSGPQPAKIELAVVPIGVQGPPGPPGPSGGDDIGGYPVEVTSAEQDDVLQLRGGKWVNVPQTDITYGGNF